MRNIKELVKKAKHGGKEAFVELIEMHKAALYNIAVSIVKNEADALDAVSEAILSCWENLPKLRKEEYFKTWLTRILMNKCYDVIRDRNYYCFDDAEVFANETAPQHDYDARLEVEAYFHKLNQNEKLILSMFYFDDYSIKQISDLLGISKSAVKTRLTRSRQHFKEIYLIENKEVTL